MAKKVAVFREIATFGAAAIFIALAEWFLYR